MFLVSAVAILLVGCTGCNHQESEKDVLAKVNGYKVLRSEVDKLYNSQIGNSSQKPMAEEEEATRLNILRSIIDVQLHLQKAEKLGIVATDDEVELEVVDPNKFVESETFAVTLFSGWQLPRDASFDRHLPQTAASTLDNCRPLA